MPKRGITQATCCTTISHTPGFTSFGDWTIATYHDTHWTQHIVQILSYTRCPAAKLIISLDKAVTAGQTSGRATRVHS